MAKKPFPKRPIYAFVCFVFLIFVAFPLPRSANAAVSSIETSTRSPIPTATATKATPPTVTPSLTPTQNVSEISTPTPSLTPTQPIPTVNTMPTQLDATATRILPSPTPESGTFTPTVTGSNTQTPTTEVGVGTPIITATADVTPTVLATVTVTPTIVSTPISLPTPTLTATVTVDANSIVTATATTTGTTMSTITLTETITPTVTPVATATNTPRLTTDRLTYSPSSPTVHIMGSGFASNANLFLRIQRPDLSTEAPVAITIDASGAFTDDYTTTIPGSYRAQVLQNLQGPAPLQNAPSQLGVTNVVITETTFDNEIDAASLALIGGAFGSRQGDSTFDPRADINHDGVVDIMDLVSAGANYGIVVAQP